MRDLIRFILIKCGLIEKPMFVARVQRDHPSPNELRPGCMTVVRDGKVDKWICFRCPGGCGEKIMLNMSAKRSPRWRVLVDWIRRPTVEPSVLQANECRCHFWVRNGKVEWCPDSGRTNQAH
jgi:hypothetical protein